MNQCTQSCHVYVLGTGKTLTGVKLVYHFVQMNQELSKKATNNATKRQVLYCGPSNSAVDVAASRLMNITLLLKYQLNFPV
jgi:hypothetical protein